MRWPYRIAMLLGFVVVVAVFSILFPPTYHGRTVNSWLDEYVLPYGTNYNMCRIALREIGPKAVPYIFTRLKTNPPPSAFSLKVRALLSKAPRFVQKLYPEPREPFGDVHACNALAAIGQPVIPALATGLENTNRRVRIACIWALARLDRSRTNALALRTLTVALQDKDARVRQHAAGAIASIKTEDAAPVPELNKLLTDADTFVRATAADALGTIGPPARDACPGLKKLLNDGDAYTRQKAAVALWRIEHDAVTALPVLLDVLASDARDLIRDAMETLGEMGPLANDAVPLLRRAIEKGDVSSQEHAEWALAKIEGDGK